MKKFGFYGKYDDWRLIMDEYKDIREALLKSLLENNSQILFDIWFKDIDIVALGDDYVIISTTNEIKKTFLLGKHYPLLSAAFERVLGFPIEIKIILSADAKEVKVPVGGVSLTPKRKPENEEKEDIGTKITEPAIITKYTFENFVVGESNKFVHAACLAVAKNDDINYTYNPLFIWGASGLGKTHLLCAVTNELKKRNPGIKIVYKKGDDFTNEFIASLQNKTPDKFREKYRTADVLLIDDIQFIAGKESTQQEFFNTFCTLHDAGKQIILTSDRPPHEINLLEDRLRTRFEWGLIADIQPPSFELRTAIIKMKAKELNITLDSAMVAFLAEKLQNNIRQIEGAINKISVVSHLTAQPITMDTCRRCVTDFLTGAPSPAVVCDKILHLVADKYNTTPEDIKSEKRNANISMARHISIFLMRELTTYTVAQIGLEVNRNYSTVIASISKIESDIKADKDFESDINEMKKQISG